MAIENRPGKAIALARIAIGILMLLEGYEKVTGPFVKSGFAKIAAATAKNGYTLWRPIVQSLVVPHANAIGWIIALSELALGIALLFGIFVRLAGIAGVLLMIVIGLGSAFPEPGAPWTAYVTRWLPAAAVASLCLIFAAENAGKIWGLDARRK